MRSKLSESRNKSEDDYWRSTPTATAIGKELGIDGGIAVNGSNSTLF